MTPSVERLLGRDEALLSVVGGSALRGNPLICGHQALTQSRVWLPAQNLTQPRVVAIAATHTLWPRQVVTLDDLLAGYRGDNSTSSSTLTSSSDPRFSGAE